MNSGRNSSQYFRDAIHSIQDEVTRINSIQKKRKNDGRISWREHGAKVKVKNESASRTDNGIKETRKMRKVNVYNSIGGGWSWNFVTMKKSGDGNATCN